MCAPVLFVDSINYHCLLSTVLVQTRFHFEALSLPSLLFLAVLSPVIESMSEQRALLTMHQLRQQVYSTIPTGNIRTLNESRRLTYCPIVIICAVFLAEVSNALIECKFITSFGSVLMVSCAHLFISRSSYLFYYVGGRSDRSALTRTLAPSLSLYYFTAK